jgi:hypothetical protein
MTAWTQQDYDRIGDRDADQVTASPLNLRAEYEHGKATAWQMTERSAEGGRNTGHIEQRHMELNGPTADQDQRTPAESAWHRGYDAGADGSVSLLRDLEKEAG